MTDTTAQQNMERSHQGDMAEPPGKIEPIR